MKNTFAAYRHLPTGAIHILDLALFSKQIMPDGATSLACEYINEDGEKVFAVIASGEQDEPGVTYVPVSEKENAEIMEAYAKCPMGIPTQGWLDIKEVVREFGEYRFAMHTTDPEHVLATVEFIEPEETINPAVNNCASPLKLTWNARESQYKVNKPLDQSGEYVDKGVADALLAALIDLKERCLIDDPEFNLPDVNRAIEIAIARSLADSKFGYIELLQDIKSQGMFHLKKGEVLEVIQPEFMGKLKAYCNRRRMWFSLPMEIIKPAKS